MFKRFLLAFLPILIAVTSLGCNANRSEDLALGSTGVSVAHDEGPLVDVFEGDYSVGFGQDFDESGSPPFSLGEGQPDWGPGQARPPLAQTTPLSQEQIQALLNRLSPLSQEEGDVAQVRLPDQSLPPPVPVRKSSCLSPRPSPNRRSTSRTTRPWLSFVFHLKGMSPSPRS